MPKSKSAFGRRLAMGALAIALLLGVGSVGFYFAKDIMSPPVTGPTGPAGLDPTIAKQRERKPRGAPKRRKSGGSRP